MKQPTGPLPQVSLQYVWLAALLPLVISPGVLRHMRSEHWPREARGKVGSLVRALLHPAPNLPELDKLVRHVLDWLRSSVGGERALREPLFADESYQGAWIWLLDTYPQQEPEEID